MRGMPNRLFSDLTQLRREVNNLIDSGRFRVHKHARASHPELSESEQITVVRYGGAIKPDRNRDPKDGVYVCWASLASHGLCRAAFCVESDARGDTVLVITAFPEGQ